MSSSSSAPAAAPPASATVTDATFARFREQTVGHGATIETPYGRKPLVYADWTASGRLYAPIERRMADDLGPLVGNTHTETSAVGTAMTRAYEAAKRRIKQHVNAGPGDALLPVDSGMTRALAKLQRLLGLAVPSRLRDRLTLPEAERPVVFVTHMEHHSNHTAWHETLADVVVIPPRADGRVDLGAFEALLDNYADRPLQIASVTAASNVTGLRTPYHAIARRIHARGGWCIVDFAAAAPYVDIDMHPDDPAAKLDAVVFSPHKCLGGPGAAGLLVFDTGLCREQAAPDIPGGGTVQWTNPWGEHRYHDAVEAREDGGTPPFLQTIRAALALQLKEQMGVARMAEHEQQLLRRTFDALDRIDGLHVLAREHTDRLGIVSFWIEDLHYNLGVRLLNDRFGIQVRGGCSCAGTYGHHLLNVSQADSKRITDRIDQGDLSAKPGWIRLSLHPTLDDATLGYVLDAIRDVATHHADWAADYRYDAATNEFVHHTLADDEAERPDATVDACFAPLP